MNTGLSDEDLPSYARTHCRTERALFHVSHVRRLLAMAGRPIPKELETSNGFYAVHEDVMDPLLEDIDRQKRKAKLIVIEGGKK